VRLFDLAIRSASGAASTAEREELLRLYAWFLPLLRLDTGPAFVHLIKLAQEIVGRGEMGTARVRAPRLALEGEALKTARGVIEGALGARSAGS
jgi:dihydrodipicolinate synthase/N-acetylneuraminate lyase